MIRYKKMRGYEVLWLPGADHAGILTQVVFEKELAKKGKTRYDLGREEFYRQCYEFSQINKNIMYGQIKKLGAFCDFSREKFTLDPQISKTVLQTFVELHEKKYVYRDYRMINWCPRCMTALSDLEVEWRERNDPLYYMRYGPFVLATVRPETKFGDTAVGVNPKDKRYKKWIGKEVKIEGLLGTFKMKVIADPDIDPDFGTGVIKVTPAHDPLDFEIGKRHNLEVKQVVGFDGKLNEKAGPYKGLFVTKARKIVAEDLEKKNLIVKIDEKYTHRVATCERCRTVIEPMVSLQWFIKVTPLAKKAIQSAEKNKIKFIPSRFKKVYLNWMRNLKDWCVSRQLWWGHRMPVWYCGIKGMSDLQKSMNRDLVEGRKEGCGKVFIQVEKPKKCSDCKNTDIVQEPDTFDTWFSSGQWPYSTLGFSWKGKQERDFDYFYPTIVMETGYEILYLWVSRMIMLGLFATGKEPFTYVYLHGILRDAKGQKMSKSKGNVINPLLMIDKYGTDALRGALIWNTSAGNDTIISEEKIIGMRNFTNKVWNIGRYIHLNKEANKKNDKQLKPLKELESEFVEEKKQYLRYMEQYKFSQAMNLVYEFLWHRFADQYIERLKEDLRNGNIEVLRSLSRVYFENLKMLHPFMPFVTEAVWKTFQGNQSFIINEKLK